MALFVNPPKTSNGIHDFEFMMNVNLNVNQVERTLVPEWYPQSGVQLTWPHAGTDWSYMLDEVTECYLRLAYEISKRTHLLVVVPESQTVKALLEQKLPQTCLKNIIFFECATNDTWARDHSFLSVVGPSGIELLDYKFNGWGGKFEASLDNAINKKLHQSSILKGQYVDSLDFELEGGSIESDGLGTLLTTAECLLNDNRNRHLDKTLIEERLKRDFGVKRVLWLDHGFLKGDDTDSHIDTLARLCPNHTIVYVQCSDVNDEHFEALQKMELQLRSFVTPEGKPYRLLALPMPDPVYDEDGERLPATSANYWVMDHAILFPIYDQKEHDLSAAAILQQAFPQHEIVGVDCRALIRQHGSLHCVTMQFPKGVLVMQEDLK